MKRKAQWDAAEKNNKTPMKNKHETEVSSEFMNGEDPGKAGNRNSKHGKQGNGQ